MRTRGPSLVQIAVVAAVVTSIKSAGAYRRATKHTAKHTDLSNPPIDLDKPDSPVDVHLLVNSNKVYGLDMIGMQYSLDFYLYFSWRDDRQKSGNVMGDDLLMNTVWSPRPEIMNREGGDSSNPLDSSRPSCVFQLGAPAFTLLNITEGKWCLCQTRVKVALHVPVVLVRFPWDAQTCRLELESFVWQHDKIRWVLPPTAAEALKPGSQNVNGFTMGTPYISIEEKYYTQFKETYDRVVFSFPFERDSAHYIGRHVLGIILLVGMAALTLCMPAEDENRLGFCQASFFGIVAWQMILTVASPPTGYDTRLDIAINTALAIVFCLFAYNAVRLGYNDWFDGQPAVVCVVRRVVAAIQLAPHAGSADETAEKETSAENSESLAAKSESQLGDGRSDRAQSRRERGRDEPSSAAAVLPDDSALDRLVRLYRARHRARADGSGDRPDHVHHGHWHVDTYREHKERLAKAAASTQVKIAAAAEKAGAVTTIGMPHGRNTTDPPGSGYTEGVGNSNSAIDQSAPTSNPPHENASAPHDRGPEPLVSGADDSVAFAARTALSAGEDALPGKQPAFIAEYVRSYVAPRDEVHYVSVATVKTSGTYMEPSLGLPEGAIKRATERDVQRRLRTLDEQIGLASAARDRAEPLAVATEECADLVQAPLVNESAVAWQSMTYGFWF